MSYRKSGIGRIVSATLFSMAGLRTAWRNEPSFRQECMAAIVLVPLAFWLGRDAVERSLLIGAIGLVLIVELLNSAIESVIDRVGTDHHELSGQAKDQGSASVFVSLVLAAVIWFIVGWDRFGPR